ALHAEVLWVRVATVAGRADSLFACHVRSLLLLDVRDLQTGEVLAVALTLLVPGLVLVLLDHNLGTAEFTGDLSADRDLRQSVGIGRDRLTVDKKYGIEFDA